MMPGRKRMRQPERNLLKMDAMSRERRKSILPSERMIP
jgi:hypothetical protein